MSAPLASLPTSDRPRERLWTLGAGALTTAELLAVVLGTGGGGLSVMDVACRILEPGEGSLRRLGTEWIWVRAGLGGRVV